MFGDVIEHKVIAVRYGVEILSSLRAGQSVQVSAERDSKAPYRYLSVIGRRNIGSHRPLETGCTLLQDMVSTRCCHRKLHKPLTTGGPRRVLTATDCQWQCGTHGIASLHAAHLRRVVHRHRFRTHPLHGHRLEGVKG